MNDTPLRIQEIVRKELMARSGEERLIMGSQMFDAAREMILASLPPNLSLSERKHMLFQRLYGELFHHQP